ncbi:MAG: hypothetical protein ABI037_03100 [Gemmatimonadales bacterium]
MDPGAPEGRPKVLLIFREQVKPGKDSAHEKVEAGWPRAFAKAKWPTNYLAMTTMTGRWRDGSPDAGRRRRLDVRRRRRTKLVGVGPLFRFDVVAAATRSEE